MSDNENMTELEVTNTADSAKDQKATSKSENQIKNGGSGDVDENREDVEKEEDAADGSGEESGEDKEEEHKEALFEAPIVVEGKRERKKTERLSITATEKEKKTIVIPDGKGVKLGDIPFTCAMLNKRKSDDVNLLHRCLYNINGDPPTRKVNIRKFCGFTFEKGSPEYEKKLDFLSRVYKDLLITQFTSILGIKQAAKKEDMVHTILDFLMVPVDSGAKPPESKRKKAQAKKKDGEPSEKKKKSPKKKSEKKDSGDADDSDSSDDSDQEGEESPKKDKKKTPPKKKPKKAATPKNKPKTEKKETKKRTPKAKTPKKPAKPAQELSSVSSDSDSDDEPLVKKIKLRTPGDDDIRDLVSKILDSSSLEDLSIRKVFQQVQESYPGVDLTDKQKFVKTTVKELIN